MCVCTCVARGLLGVWAVLQGGDNTSADHLHELNSYS